MELRFSADEEAFRDKARTWLAENVPRERRPHDGAALGEFDRAWQRTQHEGGWAGVSWPQEYGGLGLPLVQQLIWYEEYARAGLPDIDACFVGLAHAGPTLMARATDAQRSFHLPKILAGEVSWCQGFSEPQAGSDLASLRTYAERDGDDFVVSGQKIWTSYADAARYQELLVRTDREAPKHRGISWLICDMHSPGITVRPIPTIDGSSHFCEVFYDEVRIPVDNVVGDINDGWSVAMSTLSFERGTAFTVGQVQLAELTEQLAALARERTGSDGRPLIADDEIAHAIATMRAEVAALRAMTYATVSRNAHRDLPGPEGSMVKLYFSEVRQRLYRLAIDVLGDDALTRTDDDRPWVDEYLLSLSYSIGGGTSEIQRNIIGERVLGLPR
ncbi:MAG TPA: acyl-CoA dehydrogenase family protein [Mycobacteriales bacterium]|nr:acyl-CoA dehydrogenase family protein [Mycobacteriales bacterium]